MIERLKKLQADKKRFSNGIELTDHLKKDEVLRKEIEKLSETFLNKSVSGCSNCYMDAYFELLSLNIQKAMKKINSQFKLRAGALLRSRDGDISKNVSQHNLTDDLAIHHLKENPSSIKYFDKFPTMEVLNELLGEGWNESVEVPSQLSVNESEDSEQTITEFESYVIELEMANAGLSDALDSKDSVISEQRTEIASLNDTINEAVTETSALRNKITELEAQVLDLQSTSKKGK